MTDKLTYADGTDFPGVMGRTLGESEPAYPVGPTADADAPNVVFIVLDDVGFAQLGCFGSDIDTPNLDRLAAEGLRFRNFHTTAMCSPTRSCLLTGRNHHTNGMGAITELCNGFPGYQGRIPHANAFLSEILVREGWATLAVGKWHLAPQDELSMAAPRDRWPLGRGFERFYGFLGAETSQYEPDLVSDNHAIPTPRADGYHLTEDLTDQAIGFLRDLRSADPDKPFFLYFCPGACHAPHQAPREWIDRYAGRFDEGWDVWRGRTHARQIEAGIVPPGTELTSRPPWVAAWDDLADDERRLFARMMEVYAGFLSHTDHHIGRLLGELERLGELDDTIIVAISDNGASAEGGPIGSVNENLFFNMLPDTLADSVGRIDELGGPLTYGHYPWGWTMAGNTPLKRWKRETHEGGTADPLIVRYGRGVAARGEIRGQYTHAIDIAPTVLDLVGVDYPDEIAGVPQSPVAGRSFAGALADANAAPHRLTQYFEQMGCRAIYHDGWKAVTYHPMPLIHHELMGRDPFAPFDDDEWELYHVAEDASEAHDLADAEPEKLREMIGRWWVEAGRYDVLPLNNIPMPLAMRMGMEAARERYVYWPGAAPVPSEIAVNVKHRDHTIVAGVDLVAGDEGVLLAHGGRFGGYALYVRDGRLHYSHRHTDGGLFTVSSTGALPEGPTALGMAYTQRPDVVDDGPEGTVVLYVGDRQVGEGPIPRTVPMAYSLVGDGLSCGYDDGSAVADYAAPFRFTGRLDRVTVSVQGEPYFDVGLEVERALRTQ